MRYTAVPLFVVRAWDYFLLVAVAEPVLAHDGICMHTVSPAARARGQRVVCLGPGVLTKQGCAK
jgi:hypothetical protein